MTQTFTTHLDSQLQDLRETGLFKTERIISSKQAGTVSLSSGEQVINLCANNYLGLSDNEELIETGREALRRYGDGMSSVRFICGTQKEHKELEARLSTFLGMEDTNSIPPVSMPMPGCLKPCWGQKTRSFPMR